MVLEVLVAQENNIMPEIQAEYIAGFFDGEGSFSMRVHKGKSAFNLSVSAFNTHLSVLHLLQYTLSTWGIPAGMYTHKRKMDNHKQVWKLGIYSHDAIYDICAALHPYLIIKQRHAELLMEYISIRRSCVAIQDAYLHHPHEKEIADELRQLNKRDGVTRG